MTETGWAETPGGGMLARLIADAFGRAAEEKPTCRVCGDTEANPDCRICRSLTGDWKANY